MATTLGARIDLAAAEVIGRTAERAVLRTLLFEDAPLVVFVHGIGGVGKTALLAAFCAEARNVGAAVLRLDGGSIEPTAPGFLGALAAAAGTEPTSIEALTSRLARLGSRVIVVVDGYELLRPIDPWLRQTFVPGLADTVRLVLAGRDQPLVGWSAALGELFRPMALRNLPAGDAREVLRRAGVGDADARRIDRLARGHPLSLRLAAAALEDGPRAPRSSAMNAIVEGLAEVYLARLDSRSRTALEAAAVVRRPTRSLLAAMLPDEAPGDMFERVRALPFVEVAPDGLVVHDTVREAVAAYLRAADPERTRRYRIAAWRQLRDEVSRASRHEMWRYTADLLYLLENPMIREAFFPSTGHHYFVDEARTGERAAVLSLAAGQEPSSSGILEAWWERFRDGFRTARDASGEIVGFYVIAGLRELSRALLDRDPVARRCLDDDRTRPLPRDARVLIERFEVVGGAAPDGDLVRAALVLDLKRLYMELRPALRRIYTVDVEPVTAASPWARLGFEPVPGGPVVVGGAACHGAVLDFGPESVDGWLAGLIAAELGIDEPALLDVGQRRLSLDGRDVDLTRLEAELLGYLHARRGRVVDRASILRDVWGHDDGGGSNVIEAVVRSLRRKLGGHAGAIETIRGVGYRFTPPG